MRSIRFFVRFVLRFLILWAADGLSLLFAAWLLPGVALTPNANGSVLASAAAAAFMLGIVNLLIRPVILLLALPLGALVTLVIGFFVNGIALLITSNLLPVLQVEGLLTAVIAGIVLAVVNTILTGILSIDDSDSFYQGLVERMAKRDVHPGAGEPGRGLVMLEIDGLSFWHMQKALDRGILPTLKEMQEDEGYVLSRVDCGLPSQTSACQAGIMFGDNFDIPAFRWYDKDEQKLYVSGKDATAINARYAKGNGLMRSGTSINNMLSGDAARSILTLAGMREGSPEEMKRRARDAYLLLVNPYFLMRTIVLLFGDALLEVGQYLVDRSRNVQPRLNRLHGFYPLMRAACVTFMRDVAGYLATLEIIRGTPSLYTTWPGYDEVAHHTGPWTDAAFNVLGRYDGAVAHIRDIIKRKAPRPYDLILLSDHGQSFGATFLQRYGYTLKDFISQHLPQGTTVSQGFGGDNGVTSLSAMSSELDNVSQQDVSGRVGKVVIDQGRKAVDRGVAERSEPAEAVEAAQVVAYGSGNLAQVYFDLFQRRIILPELDAAYPGMVDALVMHEGIGFVGGYTEHDIPVVLGKGGRRDLVSGLVSGTDPLTPYGDPDFRAAQVLRVMSFPHAGDLMVMSTIFPDGTVAALEELIGSHGGMGGEQTDAFIFHPGDMKVPETSNSADLFGILNARRGLPVAAADPAPAAPPVVENVSAPANLGRGFKHPSIFLGRALRALVLDRSAYREVAGDPAMTGPGLAIGIAGALAAALVRGAALSPALLVVAIAAWLVDIALIFGAGRLLGGKGSFTTTLRTVGFAGVAYAIALVALFPTLAPVALFLTVAVSFLATWLAAVEALGLRGWRGLLLPIVGVVLFLVTLFIVDALATGAEMSLSALGQFLGLAG